MGSRRLLLGTLTWCAAAPPPAQAFFTRSSRWTLWQAEAEQEALLQEYRQRLAENHVAGWAPDPRHAPGELLALSRHRDRPISSLRQVLLDTPAAQPRCYRVLARLADFEPKQPAEMCHPARDCGLQPGGAAPPGGVLGPRHAGCLGAARRCSTTAMHLPNPCCAARATPPHPAPRRGGRGALGVHAQAAAGGLDRPAGRLPLRPRRRRLPGRPAAARPAGRPGSGGGAAATVEQAAGRGLPEVRAAAARPACSQPASWGGEPHTACFATACPMRRDGGPWMELSLKSFFGDSARPWQTRRYRVFDAQLQLPAQAPPAAAADAAEEPS